MSHLRFEEEPIDARYYVQQVDYIAYHSHAYLKKVDTTSQLKKGGVYVMNIADNRDFDEALPPSMRLAELDAKVDAMDPRAIMLTAK
jgi:Pyruvate/2-oxoacid:ferredoxin oxidoreductase gamma subunit